MAGPRRPGLALRHSPHGGDDTQGGWGRHVGYDDHVSRKGRGGGDDMILPEDRMPESEVALRLAFHLLALPGSSGVAEVALDGAQVAVQGARVFPLPEFLRDQGWKQVAQDGKNDWQGTYEKEELTLRIHSRSGKGDVICALGGKVVRAECKKGPLVKKAGSQEYPRLREALGQMLTVETVGKGDVLVVAVPRTAKFEQVAVAWRERPLMKQVGIGIVLVGRDGRVEGLPALA